MHKIYKEAFAKGASWEAMHFGPAHVVWEDENWDAAEDCLQTFDEYAKRVETKYTKEDLEVVRWSLEELAKLPLEERCVEPEDYDEEHPELYPPKKKTIR